MNTKVVTRSIVLAVTAVLIGWDIYVAANPTPGDTISEIIARTSREWRTIPLAWAVLAGHFWSYSAVRLPRWVTVTGLVGLGALSLLNDALGLVAIPVPVVLGLGFAVGGLLWSQSINKPEVTS